ncbi:bud emergence protein 1 [Cladophialophora psammophila CBS 110553]|uniref:Bud emergence protein 1 n=1 Tax=Cladophialophora psammophila CBS 110553 TaxID=1182543 RepID=W9WLE3_9EURO|nr:bud emergence protein 1 [Cladophialophora psammophila CBS 110553]EXJ68972.1 bud emergence protein 1 [Cladophialophora psammophila CBS 110553]
MRPLASRRHSSVLFLQAIRRSLKSDKDGRQPPNLTITPKTIQALPPKKVIKALYDYEPKNGNAQELSFHKGDFFHVLSREDDTEWYEACNPLIPSARGLVPVAFFEVVGKKQRQSENSLSSPGEKMDGHDSGFSEKGSTNSGHTRSESTATTRPSAGTHQRGPSMTGRSAGAMVYGVVQYDFHAERADELDAKAGEAIIVVAQSNPEWFVAKPIGRLGGPGLIPVSFVDIKDTATMQSVADPLEAVRKAGVPRVEEWKKFAAEYKNSSISLGKFDSPQAQMSAEMARMSLQQNASSQQSIASTNYNGARMSQQSNIPLAPISASVPRYCFDNDMYWYIIECQMEDGRWWELSRYYADFYDFQIALLEMFPEEAGNKGKPRILPFMPGPVAHVTDAISNGRRQNLDEYIKKIVAMPPHISKSMLVRNLFKPKPGQDFEIDPNALGEDYRLSAESQHSMQPVSRTSSNQQTPGMAYGGMPPPSARMSQQQRGPAPMSAAAGVTMGGPPFLHSQASNLTQNSNSSSMKAGNTGGAMKVKVFFQDDIIVLRVPQDIVFAALREKLMERLKVNDGIVIQYKDEPTNTLIDLETDDNLDVALQRNPKLTLYVNYATG